MDRIVPARLIGAVQAHVLVTLPAGAVAPAGFSNQLAAWRQSGAVSDSTLLEQHQKDDPGFEAVALLEFPSQAAYEGWNRAEASKLAAPLVVRRADVLIHGEIPRDSNKSIFLVTTYQLLVPPQRYNDFVHGYILPNLLGQRAAHLLVGYTMYLERGPAGEARAVLVREYRDSVAFGRRETVEDELVKKLRVTDPGWAKWDDTQESIRKRISRTLASYIELPPPELIDLPHYVPEYKVMGGLRIVGSDLKYAVWRAASKSFSPTPRYRPATSRVPKAASQGFTTINRTWPPWVTPRLPTCWGSTKHSGTCRPRFRWRPVAMRSAARCGRSPSW